MRIEERSKHEFLSVNLIKLINEINNTETDALLPFSVLGWVGVICLHNGNVNFESVKKVCSRRPQSFNLSK